MSGKKYKTVFPMARIKKIMQADEDVGKIAVATPVLISRALEMFLDDLLQSVMKVTYEKNGKSITVQHLKHSIESQSKFDFLQSKVAKIVAPTEDPSQPLPTAGKRRRPRRTATAAGGGGGGDANDDEDDQDDDDDDDNANDDEEDEEFNQSKRQKRRGTPKSKAIKSSTPRKPANEIESDRGNHKNQENESIKEEKPRGSMTTDEQPFNLDSNLIFSNGCFDQSLTILPSPFPPSGTSPFHFPSQSIGQTMDFHEDDYDEEDE